jgi:osmotically-inducible protein OsmY
MNRNDRFRNDVRVNQWKSHDYDNPPYQSTDEVNYGQDEYIKTNPRRMSDGGRPSNNYSAEENQWRGSVGRGGRSEHFSGRDEGSQDYNRYYGAQNDFGTERDRKRFHASSDVYPQRSSSRDFSGVGPKGYKRSDDRIEEEVCNVLLKDKNINASDIEVKVKDGIVTLSGTVENRSDKLEAEMAIEGVAGVEDINNEIKLKKWGDYSDRPYLRNSEERYAQGKEH